MRNAAEDPFAQAAASITAGDDQIRALISNEVKEFAVTPTGVPSGRTPVTTVTPVANSPNASRNWRCMRAVLKYAPQKISNNPATPMPPAVHMVTTA